MNIIISMWNLQYHFWQVFYIIFFHLIVTLPSAFGKLLTSVLCEFSYFCVCLCVFCVCLIVVQDANDAVLTVIG